MFSNNGAMPQPGKNYRPTVGLNGIRECVHTYNCVNSGKSGSRQGKVDTLGFGRTGSFTLYLAKVLSRGTFNYLPS